jgi:hypothetical protein
LIESDVVSGTNWNTAIKCVNFDSNRIEISGGLAYKATPTKKIRIEVRSVRGPQTIEQTHGIRIGTYDGTRKEILDKSYAQLSYPDTLQLPLNGEDLIVNSDAEILVTPGITTRNIPISVTNTGLPMRVDLTLSALISRIPDARFSPGNNMFFPTSAATMMFDLSIPIGTPPGVYYLEWTKSGDDILTSTSISYVYSNLKVTKVRVLNGTATVSVGEVSKIHDFGHSLFIQCELSNGPHSQLIMTPKVDIANSGLIFDPPTLTYGPGEYYKELVIYATK